MKMMQIPARAKKPNTFLASTPDTCIFPRSFLKGFVARGAAGLGLDFYITPCRRLPAWDRETADSDEP
jgi:hypothetical protein